MSGRVDSTPIVPVERVTELVDDPAALARLPRYPVRTVTPGYFETVGMHLLRGRDFGDEDGAGTRAVAVVNRTLARRLFPDGVALGRRVAVRDTTLEIVGVVGDVRQFGPQRPPEPALYTLYDQETQSWMRGTVNVALAVRPGSRPGATEVRRAVAAAGPALTVTEVRGLDELLREHLAAPRFRLWLAGIFGTLALVLAAVGVGAVAGYRVARRTREYAVRLACGARPEQVLGSIFGGTGRLAALGVGLGFPGAVLAGRFLTGILYEVSPFDPVVFAAVGAGLVAVALLAAVPPARRALRIDPARILGGE